MLKIYKTTFNLRIIFVIFSIAFSIRYQSSTEKHQELEKSNNEIKIVEEFFYKEKDNDEKRLPLHIEIKYPQIENIQQNNISNETNQILKNTAFALYNKETYEDAIHAIEEEMNKSPMSGGDEIIDYEILQLTKNYISIIFSANVFSGGPSYTTHYIAMIDLQTGKYVMLDDLVEKESIIKAVKEGHFEIYEGEYSELKGDDFYSEDIIKDFVEIIAGIEKKEDLANTKYDRYSTQNIAMDKKYIYIRFYYEDAFHQYVVMRIPIDKLKLK